MATKPSSAYLEYDSEVLTNYLPGVNAAAAQPVQSYTLNVQCFGSNNLALPGYSVLIQTSSPIKVYLNGTATNLGVSPQRFKFDESADICIVAPATGIATPSYTFSFIKDLDGKVLALPITTIDPSQKVLKRLETVKNGNDLKMMPGRSGKLLYTSQAPPSDTDLNTAAAAFKDLVSASKKMPAVPGPVAAELAKVAIAENLKNTMPNKLTQLSVSTHDSASSSQSTSHTVTDLGAVRAESLDFGGIGGVFKDIKGVGTKAGSTVGGIINAGKGVLEGTIQKSKDGIEHVVKKAEDKAGWLLTNSQWHYAVSLAGEALEFLVDQGEDIGKALENIWTKIKLGWKELESWLGFLFDWEAIIETSRSIQSLFNFSIDQFVSELSSKKINLDSLLPKFKADAKSRRAEPPTTTSANSVNGQVNANPSNQVSQTTPGKWLNHQTKYGGIMDISPLQAENIPASGNPPPAGPIGDMKTDFNKIESKLTNLMTELTTKFNLSSLVSIGDILATVAEDALDDFLTALGNMLNKLLQYVADAIMWLKTAGNTKINVPILSWIYKQITHDDLTFIGVLSLLIAIPTSVAHRLIYNESYPIQAVADAIESQKNIFSIGSGIESIANHRSAISSTKLAAPLMTSELASTDNSNPNQPNQPINQDPPKQELKATKVDHAMSAVILSGGLLQCALAFNDIRVQDLTDGEEQAPTWKSKLKKVATPFLYILTGVASITTLAIHSNAPAYGPRMASAVIRTVGGLCLLSVEAVMARPTAIFFNHEDKVLAAKLIKYGELVIVVTCFCTDSAAYAVIAKEGTGLQKNMAIIQISADTFGLLSTACDSAAFTFNLAKRLDAAMLAIGARLGFLFLKEACYTTQTIVAAANDAPPLLTSN